MSETSFAIRPENMAASKAPAAQGEARNALEVRNLNFFYGKFQGLKNVNMNIEERKVTAFIGPSGCGKSTLLRLSLIHI